MLSNSVHEQKKIAVFSVRILISIRAKACRVLCWCRLSRIFYNMATSKEMKIYLIRLFCKKKTVACFRTISHAMVAIVHLWGKREGLLHVLLVPIACGIGFTWLLACVAALRRGDLPHP